MLFDEIGEILDFLEVAIDRGVAHVGHGIEVTQPVHDKLADRFRGDIRLAAAFKPAHDAGDHLVEPVAIYGPLLGGQIDRLGQLRAVELFALAVGFDDVKITQLHTLEGGEPRPAPRA